MQATIDKLTKELGELQTEKVQKQLSDMTQAVGLLTSKMKDFEDFQETAAEAIESICTNTETVWKKSPRAVAPVEKGASRSIFKQSLEKRGLSQAHHS